MPTTFATTATSGTWSIWVDSYFATTAAGTGDIWPAWVSANATTTAATVSNVNVTGPWVTYVWIQWGNQVRRTGQMADRLGVVVRETAEQIAARQQQAKERDKERHLAVRRAGSLLRRELTPEQRQTLRQHRYFEVVSSRGRRYRIHSNSDSNNIAEVDATGQELHRYCVHPTGVPILDSLLAQKLALEHDEDAVLRVANRNPPQRSRVAA